MSALARLSSAALVVVLLAGCGQGSNASSTSPAGPRAVVAAGQPVDVDPSVTSLALSPTVDDARAVAVSWVAATGELLKMGPIGRNEFIRTRVATASAAAMAGNLQDDLAKLADRLPIPATELRLIETPITVDVSIDSATGQARAQVWSVVVFGAKDLGAPRMVFRTSELVLVVEGGEWRLASFTATEGPTPIATDALPSDWNSFAIVAGWPPAGGGAD